MATVVFVAMPFLGAVAILFVINNLDRKTGAPICCARAAIDGLYRVIRGSSWNNGAQYLRVGYHFYWGRQFAASASASADAVLNRLCAFLDPPGDVSEIVRLSVNQYVCRQDLNISKIKYVVQNLHRRIDLGIEEQL